MHALSAVLHGVVRFVSVHTGVPALVVAAVLCVVSYRIVKRSLRFVIQVCVVCLVLLALAHLGVLRL